jgi:hypothetical protein
MRMWLVDTKLLCRNHLLGEHRELHMIAGGANTLSPVIQGLLDVHIIDLRQVITRHDAVVAEFGLRGYKHYSPLENNTEDWLSFYVTDDAGVDVFNSMQALYWRCSECQDRMLKALTPELVQKLETTELSAAEVARAQLPRASERRRRRLGWSFS